ncbi:transglutaminase-like domain-containing protein [Algoriphagus lacus]|uniref:transglutaminase-like domain-containing protein n=1 Tax=Algoriphagus lacus TaxID=2056311 RepID=UPI001314BE4C|nr:transglutaminase domain-containing protein [Algoriphagus lacus]
MTKKVPVYSFLEQKTTFSLSADYQVTELQEKTITILSADGLDHASVVLMYDKLQEIKNFELEMTDPLTGKVIKKAKLRDMGDVAPSTTDFLLDNRYKFFEVTSSHYPIVVKVKSEILRKTNFSYPSWIPVRHHNQKVKESVLVFNFPTEMGLKYKELNLKGSKEIKEEGGNTTVVWTESDLEVQTPSFDLENDPKILLSPVKFAINEFQGEMNDWSGLASWQNKLNQGRGDLPEDFKRQILQMVEGNLDPYEKIGILYDYLQRNFRYVSIQLGIGGWQTMTARDVVQNKFGDCKALTTLMKSMLEVVGIPSYYTLVYAGEGQKDIEVDFPSNQFNHVILQVPTRSEPIWLECTSTLNPPGFLGNFTSDRHVLVTTPDGGYLTKTPGYRSAHWNTVNTKSKLVLDPQGLAQIESQIISHGNEAMSARQVNSQLNEREKRDYLNKSSAVAGLIVQEFSIVNDRKDSIPISEIKYKGIIQRFTQATSKRIILRPFLARITESQISFNTLIREDFYEIQLLDDLQLEGGSGREIRIEGKGYQGKLVFSQSDKIITVVRELSVSLDPGLEEADKSSLLTEINSKFDHTLTLIKPSLSTVKNE